ncbi:unnamed protein product [Symbiodinium sp. KB8]|nr:unnamed protein product [Symbiodinium sp. KB8]
MPSFQSAIGPVGSKLLISLGVLTSGFFVAWASRQVTHRSARLGLIFLVVGGFGNVADRLSVGGVIDYWLLSMSGILNTSFFWNLSDLYIDFAVILLCWAMWHGEFSHLEGQGWEGRVGWRKPIVFGISNAMVFVSLREALRSQDLLPRSLLAHSATWATLVEVAIITLQAWRGVPSHFNTSTMEDASLYVVKLISVGILGVVCFLAALAVHVRPTSTATKAVALQHGFLQLCVSVMVAATQVMQGHFFKESLPNEDALCHWATGGVSGSPCYEVRGRAVIKLAHFLPLHVTEVLLMLEWMLSIVPQAPVAIPKENVLRLAAGCCWLMSLLGIFQVLRGEPLILGVEILRHWEGLALITSMAALAMTFFWALLQPGTVLGLVKLFFVVLVPNSYH